MTSDWKYEDFLTYLLILGAQNDLEISEEEKDQIIRKVGESEFKKVKRIFDQQNDAQHIETITELYQRFKSQIGGIDNLVGELKAIFTLNNRSEHVMDRYMIIMLKKILYQDAENDPLV